MLKFNPLSDKEIQEMNLTPEGEYQFRIMQAENVTSKAGNTMIKLAIMIWDHAGRERTVYDYLMAIDSMMYKVKHFCDAVGLKDKYESGAFDAKDCIGQMGFLKLIIQKDKNGVYPDKNAVSDYLIKEKYTPQKSDVEFKDDDIPF